MSFVKCFPTLPACRELKAEVKNSVEKKFILLEYLRINDRDKSWRIQVIKSQSEGESLNRRKNISLSVWQEREEEAELY